MAKIIFWKSAIDPSQKFEYTTDKKILIEVLEQLDIDKDPLSIILNGEIPDEIPLDLELKKNDVLEIRKIVHGSSSSSKNTWATVISIVALVAATILTAGAASPWLVAGVTLAGGVASGALRYRAAKLAIRTGGQTQSEIDIEANNLSVSAAANEMRPLQPLPLPMGSTKFAPDFFNQPYPNYFIGADSTNLEIQTVFYPKYISPSDPNSWTTIIPAGFIATSPYNWPAYPVKLEPDYSLADLTAMTTSQRQDFAPQTFLGPLATPSMPIIVYHHDPADPYFGRYSPFAIFELQGTRSASQSLAIQHFFAWHDYPTYVTVYGSAPPWWSIVTIGVSPNPNAVNYFIWKLSGRKIRSFNISSASSVGVAITDYILGELNKGISGSSVGDVPVITYERQIENYVYDYPPNQAVTHIFNYGLGDLIVSDRRVEKTLVEDIPQAEYVPVNKLTWDIPASTKSVYRLDANMLEGATLNNNNDFKGPNTFVNIYDQNTYNFINRVTPIGTQWVEIDLQGQLYSTDDTGLIENSVTFEIQYRPVGQINWEVVLPVYMFNDNTHIQRRTITIMSDFSTWPTSEIEFRIRKVEKDTTNNSDKKVAQFDMTSFKCFGDETNIDLTALNTEGLYLVANTQTSGSSNKYTAQVDSKCWVYNFGLDEWNWELTRNPAWWFLYFARGGFKNPEADGTFTFPWSPTYGWVNGPGHPDSTEIMFGCGMPDSRIDIEGIKEWAIFCEDENLYIDITLKDTSVESEILEKIANIGRGSVSYYKGLLSIVYEDSSQIPVGLYGMGNIIEGTFSAEYSVANTPSKVIGSFANRDNDWETSTVEAVVPFSNTDDLNVITMTLDGITTEEQAQREVNILAARQFFQKRTYTWKVDKEGLVAKRGDLVYLAHDSTQFSYSGRLLKCIVENDFIVGVETTAEIKDLDVNFMTIRYPDGKMATYPVTVQNCNLFFTTEFKLGDAPYYWLGNNESFNSVSNYPNSYPEDYIFIAGPLATPGKIVRISQIQPDEQMNFTITAIDEDPAMWSYEYGPVIDQESFDDSVVLSRVYNVAYKQLGNGNVKIFWEVDGADFVKITNLDTGLLISADGQLSFSRGEVILELVSGAKYNLRIEPFVIGSPYKQENKVIVVWA